MILFPAIDLKDGQCVRLKKGMMADATVFNDDPAAQAKLFQAQGFQWLHCVDLNGAFAGHSANAEAIKAIRAAIDLPIQLGGGIRDLAAVEAWLAAGITRVILGTAALTNPQFVREAARKFPGRIVVGADAKGGRIATAGWADVSDLTPVDLGKRFEDAGVAAILFTDIDGDGLLGGVNVSATAALARALSIPVIASGGVGSNADIEALVAAGEPGIEGVVVGRALYDRRIDIPAAFKLAGSRN
ncbi:MAG: 1-(5-phosphoribosyl)-5-[(5-phosphoribosylamino)methylideneamino]imidazole-4-carboxamide isomerase [Alphaproteobacteria bacterium]|nr:1-(5-phosphoribosyl)-5-[(5-phosphoribosylamino)methylideneamino]imidazole-4-carboxamide isomerase [Alphaproteobacteria bacterium]